jgi:heat shock protein HslJ
MREFTMTLSRLLILSTLSLSTLAAAQQGTGQVADGTWTLTRLTDAGGTMTFGGLDAPTLRLLGTGISTAAGTQVSGSGGCNTFRTTGVFTAKTLKLGPILSTKKACPAPLMETETRYLKVLAASRSFVRTGNTLMLSTGTARAVFMYGSEAQRRLLTQWRLVGPSGNVPLTLTFTADGRVSGFSGCNNFIGQYTVDDTTLSVGPLASTRRACADADMQAQETTFLQDLQGIRRFQVAGSMLKVTTEGGKELQFARPVN